VTRQRGWRRIVKKAVDKAVAATGLIVFLPLIVLIAAVLRVTIGSPVLFRQERPGFHGRLFTLVKFRTMSDARSEDGTLLPDERRLTAVGRLLRLSSLDELPQLWNVLKGDLSLVGPRPLLVSYLERYNSEQMRRHDVIPGITGWAQIHGRNAVEWRERFALDLWYVDHWSLWLDLRILTLTIGAVLRRLGISRPGHATMTEFTGNKDESWKP
jgi:lipopolysaccharide/colanic/teichoic acid biosynthesis glycosyltransferase